MEKCIIKLSAADKRKLVKSLDKPPEPNADLVGLWYVFGGSGTVKELTA